MTTAWTEQTWDAFCALLQDMPSRDAFDDDVADTMRVWLDAIEPQVAIEALRRTVLDGQKWRPTGPELLAAARRDPGKPTWDEAFRLIFGPGGALAARPTQRRYGDDGERRRLEDAAALERCQRMHPLIGAWLAVMTPRRLRMLELDDPEWGEARRVDLHKSFEAFAARTDDRQIAALAAGGDVRRGLRQLDPLAALGGAPAAREQITAGGDAA